jgi:hypothetical protein
MDGMEPNSVGGRGLCLCRYYLDELEFIGNGNAVRARKRRASGTPANGSA